MTQVDEITSGTTIHVVCLPQPIPIKPADALVTLGARASTGMALIPKAGIFHLQLQKS